METCRGPLWGYKAFQSRPIVILKPASARSVLSRPPGQLAQYLRTTVPPYSPRDDKSHAARAGRGSCRLEWKQPLPMHSLKLKQAVPDPPTRSPRSSRESGC